MSTFEPLHPVYAHEKAAQKQKTSDESDGTYHSPVPNLIALLEPILEKAKQGEDDLRNELDAYLAVLDLSRREINELENIARFLRHRSAFDSNRHK